MKTLLFTTLLFATLSLPAFADPNPRAGDHPNVNVSRAPLALSWPPGFLHSSLERASIGWYGAVNEQTNAKASGSYSACPAGSCRHRHDPDQRHDQEHGSARDISRCSARIARLPFNAGAIDGPGRQARGSTPRGICGPHACLLPALALAGATQLRDALSRVRERAA